jgi:hypothetical protein
MIAQELLNKEIDKYWKNEHGKYQAVSEEKIFKIRPIRNKNCLWWPCLLMERDKMSNL